MNQIQKLKQRLTEIGFVIQVHENVLQIIGLSEKNNAEFGDLEFEKVSHVLRVTIELEDPFSEGGKFIFQDCSLKVYYDEWDLMDVAKIIKLNIAEILNENGIFEGMGFEIPKDYKEVLVP